MGAPKVAASIIAIFVTIIVVALVAVPVINESSESIKTVENNTNEFMVLTDEVDEPITYTFTSVGYTANGVTYNGPMGIATDSSYFRYYVQPNWVDAKYYDNDGTIAAVSSLTINTDMTFTITNADGVVTTGPFEWIYYPDTKGQFGQFRNSIAYLSYDSSAYVADIYTASAADESQISILLISKITYDGYEIIHAAVGDDEGKVNVPDTSVTISATKTDVDNLYWKLNPTISGTVSYNNVEYAFSASFSMIVAPLEYDFVTDVNGSQRAMLLTIPVMLLIVPIMMAIRLIQGRGE